MLIRKKTQPDYHGEAVVVRRETKDVSATPRGNRDVLWLGRGAVPPMLEKLASKAGLRLRMRTDNTWPAPRIAWLENLGVTARDNSSLANRRVAVLHPDPGAADALAEAVRAKGARAVVLSLSEVGITRAEALDPEVIVLSPTHMVGACASMLDALWNHPRMRWTPMLLVPDERLGPAGLNAPDVRELAIAVGALCAEHVLLERRAQRDLSFELALHALGPLRVLRALLESGRSLRILFEGPYLAVEVDVAEGIVVGARAGEQRPDEAMLLGVHALTALFTETSATVRVKRVERPAATNIMAPLDALLLGDRKAPAFISEIPAANTQTLTNEPKAKAAPDHHEPETLKPPPKPAVNVSMAKPPARETQKTPAQGVGPFPTRPVREPQKTPAQGVGPLPTRAVREPQETPARGVSPPATPLRGPQKAHGQGVGPGPTVPAHATGLPALRAPGQKSAPAVVSTPHTASARAFTSTLLMGGPPRAPIVHATAARPGPLAKKAEKPRTSELENAIASALDEHSRPTRGFKARNTEPPPIEPVRPSVQISRVIAPRAQAPVANDLRPVAFPAVSDPSDFADEPETIEVSISETLPAPPAVSAQHGTNTDAFEAKKTSEWEATTEDEPTVIGITSHEQAKSSLRPRLLWAAAALCVLGLGAGAWRFTHGKTHVGDSQVAHAAAPPLPTETAVAAATPHEEKAPAPNETAPPPSEKAEPEANDVNGLEVAAQAEAELVAEADTEDPSMATRAANPETSLDGQREQAEIRLSDVSPEALARADDIVLEAHKWKRSGDLQAARATYEKALQVVPGYPRALCGVAETYLAQGEKQRALETTLTLLTRRKRFPDDYRLLGDIHVALGNTDAALEAYRVASLGGSRVAREKLRALR